jgi:hypothetical protein
MFLTAGVSRMYVTCAQVHKGFYPTRFKCMQGLDSFLGGKVVNS